MKLIKKIFVVIAGTAMIGATLMGAMASNSGLSLRDYPSPLLIQDSNFNGEIVYGAKADPSDIMGLVDAVAAISVIETDEVISSTEDVAAIGEAIKIETDTNKLNIGDNLTEVKSVALDDDDMPNILADDKYRSGDNIDYNYEQKIKFDDNVAFSHWTDSDYKAKTPTLGIKIPRNSPVLNYTLLFSKAVESEVENGDLVDLEDSTIQILGKEYDIVEADNSTSIKLTLMRGAIKDVLEQGQKKSYTINEKEYAVEVTYIGGENPSRVKFKVNGETTTALEEDGTYKLSDGTQIGIREILEEEAGEAMNDMVEFYLGAEKIVLEDNEQLEIADEDIDDITVYIDETFGTKTSINSIVFAWIADDDTFIAKDSEVSFPGLDSFKISYEGLTTPKQEEIMIENNGNYVMEMTVPIKSGQATISLLGSNQTGGFSQIGGDGLDEILRTSSGTSITYNDNTDQYFVATYATGADGESYQLTISDIDDVYGVDFKDVVNSNKYENKKPGTATASFNVGSVTLTVDSADETTGIVNLSIGTDCYFDILVTKEGLLFELPVDGSNINLSTTPSTWTLAAYEENKEESLAYGSEIDITLGHTTDYEVEVDDVASDWAAGEMLELGNTREREGYVKSDLGTKALYDADPDQKTAKIIYNGKQAYGNVYISEIAATFTKTTAELTKVLKKVNIPIAKSDDDILEIDSLMNKNNYLLIGGPCANAATAKVLGLPTSWPECATGFKEGIGRLILKETDGKYAVVVAGMTALDTTRATRVLKDYTKYTLDGSEIEIAGTGVEPISVKVVKE